MRDLGVMGESIFSLWCGDAGLIPNGSQIDRTGWDYYVEFPFGESLEPEAIHQAAMECKVQVKATDRTNRKLPITLSNLRRLVTAQMPSFFVFIEFDGKPFAQRAFVVHVDKHLVSKVLERIHEIEQSDEEKNFNKRTMTIKYSDLHLMSQLSGACLKSMFLTHIGNNMISYVAEKRAHLESTGFEQASVQVDFTTSQDNLKALVDMSIGIEGSVPVDGFRGTKVRFGIPSKLSVFEGESGRITMPDVKPRAEGLITFSKDRLLPGLSFRSVLYISPFNAVLPKEYWKLRIEGNFFDLRFNPCTGEASLSFSLGDGVSLDVESLRNAVRLLSMLHSSENQVVARLDYEDFSGIEFKASCFSQQFDLQDELRALNVAVRLKNEYDITSDVTASLRDISKYASEISQMELVFQSSPGSCRLEFEVEGEGFDPETECACVFFLSAPVGDYVFGAFIVFFGLVELIGGRKYRLNTNYLALERKVACKSVELLSNEALIEIAEKIEKKYDAKYSVVKLFDSSSR